MTDDDPLAAFEAHRARLFGVAYRMLGSAADADDVLQDARLRWLACDRAAVRDVRGFLVTMVTRQALDVLGSARARREQYVGPWLPEPIATAPAAHAHDLSLAFLRLLERLSPPSAPRSCSPRCSTTATPRSPPSSARPRTRAASSPPAPAPCATAGRARSTPRPTPACSRVRSPPAPAATSLALERLLAADAAVRQRRRRSGPGRPQRRHRRQRRRPAC
jgi:hypothetical protein